MEKTAEVSRPYLRVVKGSVSSIEVDQAKRRADAALDEKPLDAVNFLDTATVVAAGMIVLALLAFLWRVAPMVKP